MKWLKLILSGEFFKLPFWQKNVVFLGFIVGMFFIYILITSYGDILEGKLQAEQKNLSEIKEKYVMYKAEVMNHVRKTNIDTLVRNHKLSIQKPTEPAYILIIDTTENE